MELLQTYTILFIVDKWQPRDTLEQLSERFDFGFI